MKLEFNDTNVFMSLWINHDPDLWAELRPIQLRLLVDRIVNKMSFEQLAQEHNTTIGKLRLIFDAIIIRIDRCISPEVAKFIRLINEELNARTVKPFDRFIVFQN